MADAVVVVAVGAVVVNDAVATAAVIVVRANDGVIAT